MPVKKVSDRLKQEKKDAKPQRKWVNDIRVPPEDVSPKERRSAKYKIGRQRYTRVPGYGSHLPRTFPYKKTTTPEDAILIFNAVMSAELGSYGICVQNHPDTVDGHVIVWLSIYAAEYLQSMDMLGMVEDTM